MAFVVYLLLWFMLYIPAQRALATLTALWRMTMKHRMARSSVNTLAVALSSTVDVDQPFQMDVWTDLDRHVDQEDARDKRRLKVYGRKNHRRKPVLAD